MGIIETDDSRRMTMISSDIFLYGEAISEDVRSRMEEEINTMWNEPGVILWLASLPYRVRFNVRVSLMPQLHAEDVRRNRNPRNNYFRIEEFARGNISFVDGLGSNTGYFKLDNLYQGSTTGAHEYGHTLGLAHPEDLDLRGKGRPGIMYPRGTLVDPEYQYKPEALPGEDGGTLYPIHRRVSIEDILLLNLDQRILEQRLILGAFTSRFHEKHDRERGMIA